MKEGWKIRKLGEITSFVGDGDWIESKDQSPGGIRLIQTGNIGGGIYKDKGERAKYISPETFYRLHCTEIFAGDCLVSRLPDPIGRACILPKLNERTITAVDCSIIRFKPTFLPQLFVYYSLSNRYQSYINTNATGTTRKRISRKRLEQAPIPIPPIHEQERIVAELDCLTGIIEKKKQQLEELAKLAQSIFYDMFGDPIVNEKGWETSNIGSLCADVRYGTSRPACDGGKYAYLRMGNLTYEGSIDLTDTKRIDIPDNEIEKCIVRKGDVLFNRTNSLDLVGKTCLFDLDEEMVIAGYIIRVRLNRLVLPVYLVRTLNTSRYKNVFRALAKGAVNQANINAKEFQSVVIPVPPLNLQEHFAKKIEAIEKEKELVKRSIVETETLFNSRMDYWFN